MFSKTLTAGIPPASGARSLLHQLIRSERAQVDARLERKLDGPPPEWSGPDRYSRSQAGHAFGLARSAAYVPAAAAGLHFAFARCTSPSYVMSGAT